MEIKPCLQNTQVEDEELSEKLKKSHQKLISLPKLENWKQNWPLSRKVCNNKVVITPTDSITLQNKGGPALKGAGVAKDVGGVSIATIASLVLMLATSVTNA